MRVVASIIVTPSAAHTAAHCRLSCLLPLASPISYGKTSSSSVCLLFNISGRGGGNRRWLQGVAGTKEGRKPPTQERCLAQYNTTQSSKGLIPLVPWISPWPRSCRERALALATGDFFISRAAATMRDMGAAATLRPAPSIICPLSAILVKPWSNQHKLTLPVARHSLGSPCQCAWQCRQE